MKNDNEQLRLFDENFRYTQLASDIDIEFHQAIEPIFEKYFNLGCSPRELDYIANQASLQISLGQLIGWSAELKKNKEN